MRVILEVVSGPDAGKKILLAAGQSAQVGRTEWADFAFPHDGQMSGKHFLLETESDACYIKDQGSSNGTSVNRRRIAQRTRLSHGDEIRAGQTVFVVRMEGAAPAPAKAALPDVKIPDLSLAAPAGLGSAPPAGVIPQVDFEFLRPQAQVPSAPVQVNYTIEKCDSGLTLCRGTVDEIPPADMAIRICQLCPVYLIVDFRKLGEPRPEELSSPQYLFDFLDPVAAAAVSPVIVAQEDLLAWPSLVEKGWGTDAVICLFSKQEKPSLLSHLRRSCQAKPNVRDPNGPIIGYCWPSVLAPLLSHYKSNFLQEFIAGIDAVLVELADLPVTWQVYGGGEVVKMLDQLGFRQRPPERAGPGGQG